MKILQPKHNGFCSGVNKAVQTAFKYAGANVYCYGEIVHNPIVVAELAQKGLNIEKDL